MGDKYDITYVVNRAPQAHVFHMSKVVRVLNGQPDKEIVCDTLIMLRILDKIPKNITYKHSIRMCHACKTKEAHFIPQDCDQIVNVSETSKRSFGKDAENAIVINNIAAKEIKEPILLISATRIPAPDKGNNEKRMMRLAEMLNEAEIPYIWLNFSDGYLENPPKGFHNMGLDMNAASYFKFATYVVQLSDVEAFPYVVLEAITQNVPVLVTEFESVKDFGIVDGVHGYILPFDMNFDIKRILNVPKFKYKYDNDSIIEKWEKLLGAQVPFIKYVPDDNVLVEVIEQYNDLMLNQEMITGTRHIMTKSRADYLAYDKHLVKIIGGM